MKIRPPLSRAWRARSLFAALTAAFAGHLTVSSCGSEAGGGGTDPCEGNPACGVPCRLDADCAENLHCGPGEACTAACSPGGTCPDGSICDARGRCGAGAGAGGASASAGIGGGFHVAGSTGTNVESTGTACPDIDVQLEKQIPTVILLVDQSGSMTTEFEGGQNRWDVLRDSLLASDGVIKTLENDVRFGLALYSAIAKEDTGPADGSCPILTRVGISLGNYQAIKQKYEDAFPLDETPTGDSIAAITPELAGYSEPGPKVIVLATDGEPDTCAQANPQKGQEEAVAAVEAAFAQGIRTYAVSVGTEVGEAHLQDVANAGLGLGESGGAKFYVATNKSGLISAFDEILEANRSCVFTLNGSVKPGDEPKGVVTIDGEPVAYGDPDGWKLNAPNELELVGEACKAIQGGDHTVSVKFPCGSVEIPK